MVSVKTLEDAVEALALIWMERPDQSGIRPWAYNFLIDMAGHVLEGKPLSVRQSDSVINILKCYHDTVEFTPSQSRDILWLVDNPTYRNAPLEVKRINREVRLAAKDVLAFKFPFNNFVKDTLKSFKPREQHAWASYPMYVPDHKVWLVRVDEYNHEKVMQFIKNESFDINDDVVNFFMDIANSIGVPSQITLNDDHIEVVINNDPLFSKWLDLFCEDHLINEN